MKIDKTILIRYVFVAVAAVCSLPAMAQWENSKPFEGAVAPAANFRSTGSMVSVGSTYSATPALNADGSVAYPGASYSPSNMPNGPRRVPGTPGGNPDEDDQQPIGDTPWLWMMLLAGIYGLIKCTILRHPSQTKDE